MRLASVALLALGVAASVLAVTADKPSGPWVDPANAERYAFVGHDVWDVANGKLIAPGGAPLVYEGSRPVAGRPDRLWMRATELGLPGMPGEGLLYSTTDLYQSVHPTLNGEKWSSMGDYPGFWIASDFKRAVWIEKGDIWRGRVDWTAGKVVDRSQVTHVGVFTGKAAVAWTADVLYVNGGFDAAKPIVRIDLKTGTTEELEAHHVFNAPGANYTAQTQAGMASPSAAWLIGLTAETIYTFDARTGTPGTIANPLFNNKPVSSLPDLTNGDIAPVWLGEDAVAFVNAQLVVTKVDLRKREARVLFTPYSLQGLQVHVFGVVPGGHYLDLKSEIPAHDAPPAFKERFLLDLVAEKTIPTSLTQDADGGLWVDDSRLAYARKTGGLAGVGTWLYDRTTDKAIRISPTQLETTRMTLLRGGKEIWAVNSAGGPVLYRAKVDGSGAEELGPAQMSAPMQFPVGPPVDLGLPPAPPASVSAAAPAAAAALPVPAAAVVAPAPAAPAPAASVVTLAPTAIAPAPAASPVAPAPATTAPPTVAQPLYAMCSGRQPGPEATAYFAALFPVHTLDVAGWSAAFKAYLQDRYAFTGVIYCGTAQSLAAATQRRQQIEAQMAAHWKIVETGWRFE